VFAWRNENQCGVSLDLTRPDVEQNLLDMSTELDWMTFLAEVNQSIPFGDIMDVYRRACQPENQETNESGVLLSVCTGSEQAADGCFDEDLTCSGRTGFDFVRREGGMTATSSVFGRPVYWRDRPTPIDPESTWTEVPPYDRGGFLDGAIRRFGPLSDEVQLVEVLGLEHAVADELP